MYAEARSYEKGWHASGVLSAKDSPSVREGVGKRQ